MKWLPLSKLCIHPIPPHVLLTKRCNQDQICSIRTTDKLHCTIQFVFPLYELILDNVGSCTVAALGIQGFPFEASCSRELRHKTCGMTAPVKQRNASSDDDTKGNLCSCRCSHWIITLPLASTENHISNIFSAGLNSQIFVELFSLPAVVTCIVLRFWDTRGREGRAALGKKQVSTLATCARRSVGNSEGKMAFTKLILKTTASSPSLGYTASSKTPNSKGQPCQGQTGGTRISFQLTAWFHQKKNHPVCTTAEPRCEAAYMQSRWASAQLSVLTAYMHPLSLTICYMKENPMHI